MNASIGRDFVEQLILAGNSHKEISSVLKEKFQRRVFSERSVRRFCHKYDIHKPKGDKLDEIIKQAVKEVHDAVTVCTS